MATSDYDLEKHRKWSLKANSWFKLCAAPLKKLSKELEAQDFWPTSLDQESDKAARILRSFCIDGFYSDQGGGKHGTERKRQRTLDHIPPEIIRNAKGLAIFTISRYGLYWAGAGCSGVIVKKLPNGQWSPPSGIQILPVGRGLVAGADIYDCVAVINNDREMAGFTRVGATIGAGIPATVGPLGGGTTLRSEVFRRRAPVWTYIKSRRLYIGVQIDGTMFTETTSENERFYGANNIRHANILAGQVQVPPGSMVQLWETLQAAEGRQHNPRRLPPPNEPSPGDRDFGRARDASEMEGNALAYAANQRVGRRS